MYYAIGMLGVRQDRVEHTIDMKYIGEQDTMTMGWSTVLLESKEGTRISINCMTLHLREIQLQPGELFDVLVDKMDHAVWMLERMKKERYVDVAPGENVSDKIERLHKSWNQMPFHEDNLPKEETKEAEPPSAPPETVQPVNNLTLVAKLPDVKEEKSETTAVIERAKNKLPEEQEIEKSVKEGKEGEKGKATEGKKQKFDNVDERR